MTDVQSTTASEQRSGIADLGLLVALELVALVMSVVYDATDVTLAARAGSQVQQITLTGVLVTTTVVTALAVGLRWLLRHRENGLRTWSVVAGVVWAVSFLGPLGAPTTESVLALASFHLVIGAGIFFGVRSIHRALA